MDAKLEINGFTIVVDGDIVTVTDDENNLSVEINQGGETIIVEDSNGTNSKTIDYAEILDDAVEIKLPVQTTNTSSEDEYLSLSLTLAAKAKEYAAAQAAEVKPVEAAPVVPTPASSVTADKPKIVFFEQN
jgi:hypothetical protein